MKVAILAAQAQYRSDPAEHASTTSPAAVKQVQIIQLPNPTQPNPTHPNRTQPNPNPSQPSPTEPSQIFHRHYVHRPYVHKPCVHKPRHSKIKGIPRQTSMTSISCATPRTLASASTLLPIILTPPVLNALQGPWHRAEAGCPGCLLEQAHGSHPAEVTARNLCSQRSQSRRSRSI